MTSGLIRATQHQLNNFTFIVRLINTAFLYSPLFSQNFFFPEIRKSFACYFTSLHTLKASWAASCQEIYFLYHLHNARTVDMWVFSSSRDMLNPMPPTKGPWGSAGSQSPTHRSAAAIKLDYCLCLFFYSIGPLMTVLIVFKCHFTVCLFCTLSQCF